MNTSKALKAIKKHIEKFVPENIKIFNDTRPEGEIDSIVISVLPVSVQAFIDDEADAPDRRVSCNINFSVCMKNATTARNLAEKIVAGLSGMTLASEDGSDIDFADEVTVQFQGTDEKKYSTYITAIDCQYDINELEE